MRHDCEVNRLGRAEKVPFRVLGVVVFMATGWCTWAAAQEGSAPVIQSPEIEILLDVLACVESGNDPNAVGDRGRALGLYQIHRAYWEDGTRILGVNWSYREAFNADKARCVVRAYLLHHGSNRTLSDMARIHNGGPRGHYRRSTLCYAQKVDRLLAQRVDTGRL